MQRALYVLITFVTFTMTISPIRADILRGDDDGMINNEDIFNDLDEWLAAVPPVTIIDFTDYPFDTIITDQYADLGINFTNGTDFIREAGGFVDGHAISNNTIGDATIRIVFDEPLTVFGSLFVGLTWYFFYLDDELIGWTTTQGCFADVECFAGFILDTPFDELHIHDFTGGSVAVDNLYFTFDAIPAPGAAAPLLALLAIFGNRRRRQ